MEQLTIEQIAIYLPYNLQGIEEDSQLQMELIGLNGNKCLLKDCNFQRSETFIITEFTKPDYWQSIKDFKPILRPMSDLSTKEFVELCEIIGDGISYGENSELRIWNGSSWERDLTYMPYKGIVYLSSKHFDFQGLINVGLAIDINTIKTN